MARLAESLLFVGAVAARHGRAFAAGWTEGGARFHWAKSRSRQEVTSESRSVPASRYPRGSIAFAASEAAVAYCAALQVQTEEQAG